MTANAMQGDREKCLEAGMDDQQAYPSGGNGSSKLSVNQIEREVGKSKCGRIYIHPSSRYCKHFHGR